MKGIEALKRFISGTVDLESHKEVINIDGSSTVYPITKLAAEDFQKARRGTVEVTIGVSGTGGGFKKFCGGKADILNASRPILQEEIDACREADIKYIELALAFDGIAVVINADNRDVMAMTAADLKKIWEPVAEKRVTKWCHAKPAWPETPLRLYAPGVSSGTFHYFTKAIVGKPGSSRRDFTPCENHDVVARRIAADKDGLGFLGYAYYVRNKRKLGVALINGGNWFLLPSEHTVMSGTYQPLTRPIFIYVNKKSVDRPEVKEFVEFYLHNARRLVRQASYFPLPDIVYELVAERFRRGVTGTVFAGETKIGIRIEDLVKLIERH